MWKDVPNIRFVRYLANALRLRFARDLHSLRARYWAREARDALLAVNIPHEVEGRYEHYIRHPNQRKDEPADPPGCQEVVFLGGPRTDDDDIVLGLRRSVAVRGA